MCGPASISCLYLLGTVVFMHRLQSNAVRCNVCVNMALTRAALTRAANLLLSSGPRSNVATALMVCHTQSHKELQSTATCQGLHNGMLLAVYVLQTFMACRWRRLSSQKASQTSHFLTMALCTSWTGPVLSSLLRTVRALTTPSDLSTLRVLATYCRQAHQELSQLMCHICT